MISVNTKLLCLLGTPLGQTLSPKLQNETYEALGLDYFYFPIEVNQKEDLPVILAAVRKMNFAGFAITKPYKIEILKHVDRISPLAEKIGSSNTVLVEADGSFTAHNTDGVGFTVSLMGQLGQDNLNDKTLCVLGAGGASRAGTITAIEHGLKTLYISDVVPEAAHALIKDINDRTDAKAVYVDYQDKKAIADAFANSNVALNATGVGMLPHLGESPVDPSILHPDLFCCDMIYNPAKSKFLEDAEQRGCRIMNGFEMFLRQAAAQVKLWTGREASLELMSKIMA